MAVMYFQLLRIRDQINREEIRDMFNIKKNIFTPRELLSGNYGIERESLRIDNEGKLSMKPHPHELGDKGKNPYITTDFSESQVELITPTFKSVEEVYNFINTLYDITAMNISDEYLWPQSMPCVIPEDDKIPVAQYEGNTANTAYREKLLKKYGGKKQLISGIHYNFSFTEEFIKKLYEYNKPEMNFGEYKNAVYLKVARNFLRYRWLVIYLMAGTAAIHYSYVEKCRKNLKEFADDSYTNDGAMSYRNSECGYKNKVDLYPSYKSVDEYISSVQSFVNDKLIECHKELYSAVRLKPKDKDNFYESLSNDGINYLEFRCIDINPFEKCGISLNDLYFLQIFNLYLLTKEESSYDNWQEEALKNENSTARFGQNDITLLKDGERISRIDFSLEILNEMRKMNDEFNLGKADIIDEMIKKVEDKNLTYAHKLYEIIKKEGYVEANLNLAKEYRKSAYNNRFKLYGYEDLELSTQILMKESIKHGLKVSVVDRSENFISIENGDHIEYVKQATKTSKDNYVTVLIMENKTVTKKVLQMNNVCVPQGVEFDFLDKALSESIKYVNKPIVIKPKSTNFGTGISIFSEGANKESIDEALKIAFKFDNTVLLEEFIRGKEYRFLVIGDEVAGILHRVPANVIGDGKRSIRELVAVKNEDPLRGYHYVTPLEKINLDENVALFLKQQHKDFDYIPAKEEIVYLRENSNISTGGDSIDYTDLIPKRFKDIAVDCAKAVNAKICGVDMMLEDYSDENSNYAIIELNFNPAIHIHSYPYKGIERNIAVKLLKLLELI